MSKLFTQVNDHEAIFSALTRTPEHLGVLRKIILKEPTQWADAFSPPKDLYVEEFDKENPFLSWLAYSAFKWCGCNSGMEGRFETLYQLMVIMEKACDKHYTLDMKLKDIENLCGDTSGSFDIIMDYFSDFSLFSHGGSNTGSWIDYDGHIVYAHLKHWKAMQLERI